MESVKNQATWCNVAEVEMIYKSKVKASDRPKIRTSKDAAELLKELWNDNKIDFIEQFKYCY